MWKAGKFPGEPTPSRLPEILKEGSGLAPAPGPGSASVHPMPLPPSIAERVETFRRNLDSYLAPDYKEAELRREFLDPFFEALGWDVFNRLGHAEAYKDVVHEDSLKISGDTKAPDYSFRIGGTRKFFVEAKKPAVRVKDDPEPAKQLRRYSWSAKLPLGIVTDFHEFAIYDTRIRPKENDKASAARLFYCTFEDYPAKWDEIAGTFSKAAVLSGSFDKYAATSKGKRGTAEFDDDFLADMEAWRKRLAENLALRNSGLSQRDLNFAVQRILDRLIFLRIAEDRGIERLGQLQALTAGPKIYPRFCDICRHADLRYNSGLFHFETEKGRDESPDRLTLGLHLDDAVFKDIISSLYYPKSPYAFAVIPADVLGHVYEQFLGKVIHLTEGHRAKVEEKPEVRKAGGVYYTPTYIVDYIVRQTVGPLVEGRTPKQVEKLRILDPACGSGSFLLGAFDYLLDWHLKYYLANDPAAWARKKHPPIYETAPNAHGIGRGSGNWQLTTAERKRILLANLHGVDIDAQAVEVTKLSLLLKVLEGEARELQGKQLDFHRVLPDLGHNIKCGNSLIGSDFYTQPNLPQFDDEARYKLNAFDWVHEFKPIMNAGGFDAVIGNPPYLNVDEVWGKGDPRTESLRRTYPEVYNDKTDLLFYFLAKSLKLSRGRVSMIVSRAFLEAFKADKLRSVLSRTASVEQLIDFQNYRVFPGVGITTCILCFSLPKSRGKLHSFRLLGALPEPTLFAQRLNDPSCFEHVIADRASLTATSWSFRSPAVAQLNAKIDAKKTSVGNILVIGQGMQTGCNEVFTVGRELVDKWKLPVTAYYFRATNSSIQRYRILPTNEVLLFPDSYSKLENVPTHMRAQLESGEAKLKNRAAYKRGNCEWWQYTWPLHKDYYTRRRLVCPFLARENRFALVADERRLGLTDTTVLFENEQPESLYYFLGLLNSKLLTFRFRAIGKLKSGGIYEYFWNSISKLPIRRIDFDTKSDRLAHDTLVAHVERMLKLHERVAAAKSPDEQTHLQREIAATDRAIDQFVYHLYGLTEEEIHIVEQSSAPVSKALEPDGSQPLR